MCLHLLSDDIYVLHSYRVSDWRSCGLIGRTDLRSVCARTIRRHTPVCICTQATVCFHWRESIYLRSVCHDCLHLPSDDVYAGTSFYRKKTCTQRQARRLIDM